MLLKGALIEYGTNLLGPIPNVVIFQFNPESLTRTLQIPDRPTGAMAREVSQAGDVPVERISFTAQFTTQEMVVARNPLTRYVGIGPQLAALEKLVHPQGKLTDLLSAAIDRIGDALSGGRGQPSQPVPRQQYPRVLFVWGLARVLPVIVDSMQIAEKQYDSLLNPTQADVDIGLTVIRPDPCGDDLVAAGASKYTSVARDALAAANLVTSAQQAAELIPF